MDNSWVYAGALGTLYLAACWIYALWADRREFERTQTEMHEMDADGFDWKRNLEELQK